MVYSTRRFVLCLTLYYFILVFFIPFSIAITSLGEERANLNAFRTCVRFAGVSLTLALWFILRGDLLYVFPCVILFLCFSVLLVLRLPRLGKRELILVLFVRLFGLCLFRFVGFLFLLGSGKGCGLWLCQSLDFSLTFFFCACLVLSVCSSSWWLGWAAVCDCGTSWTFLYLFLETQTIVFFHLIKMTALSIVSKTSISISKYFCFILTF